MSVGDFQNVLMLLKLLKKIKYMYCCLLLRFVLNSKILLSNSHLQFAYDINIKFDGFFSLHLMRYRQYRILTMQREERNIKTVSLKVPNGQIRSAIEYDYVPRYKL
jgi:hypothetical protein